MMFFARNTTLFLIAITLIGCDSDNDNNFIDGGSEPPELMQETLTLPSAAQPAFTPGSPGVVVTNPALLEQFGSNNFSLNNAVYTRYSLSDQDTSQPDAILVLVPGFEGGAANFSKLAENLMLRAQADTGQVFEVWAVDRRSNQLEDLAGFNIAEREQDASIGLNFLFGEELGMPLEGPLQDELGRRAIIYNSSDDLAFFAQWTELTHSQDIDAVVEAARDRAANNNVFLGGHSAGTGYAARYAATDLDLTPAAVVPGYAKLRGLVMFDGGGGRLGEVPSEALLDSIEARFDGGLYGAVRDQAPRCIDGLTACTVDTESTDCGAFANTSCTESTTAYTVLSSLLPTEVFAASSVSALDAAINGDGVISILQADQGGIPGNNAIEQISALAGLQLLLGSEPASSTSLMGNFLDDDGLPAGIFPFLAVSVGAPGPADNGVNTWLGIDQELPAESTPDNGPAPTDLAASAVWGVEAEVTDLVNDILPQFYAGDTNFTDWYYPASGLSVTSGLGLDSSALSAPPPVGRGRSDIANRTQASNVDIPVISFGGSNGLLPVSGGMLGYAETLAACAAPACDSLTPRVIDTEQPSTAFPTFGDASGGFEVVIAEGYSHLDVITAVDDETNPIIEALLVFMQRHLQ
ncbi:alpha/beta fold hydrolase [Halieaceae bacterium IMCC14734]|uniref:Alpha/beta fold hydrolase n=2 Tax=Candidatus Litorirhabdus singularis TaxID=2518993 RepID=A0ABT3TNU9_9GAMM|nr:alpha/beta fold hydrolase [Candidatus Litorirhabdus singularis]